MPKPQKMLIWTGEETMGDAEFRDAFQKVLEVVKKIQENNARALEKILSTFGSLKTKLDSDTSATLAKTERTVAAELDSLLRRFSDEQRKIDQKLAELKDGVSPELKDIVSEVMAQIVLPEYKEFILTAEDVRDKLQTLQGEEKLHIKDIWQLQEELDKIKKKGAYGGVGSIGGISTLNMDLHFYENITPTGIPNGTLKDFTLAQAPNPVTSLKIFVNGIRQKLTEDYTFTGVTISFVVAPPEKSLILCDYRK